MMPATTHQHNDAKTKEFTLARDGTKVSVTTIRVRVSMVSVGISLLRLIWYGGELFSFTDNDEIAKQCCKIVFIYHSWQKKQAIYVTIHLCLCQFHL